jgi:transposase
MSMKERVRLDVFSRVKRGEISVGKAARLVGLSVRQGRRIWRRFQRDGDAGLVHRLRGRPGNAGDPQLRQKILERVGDRYADFGSVLAAEYLRKDGLVVSSKTLWRWRRHSGGLGPIRRASRHRIRRERRSGVGELVQMDGSTHDWFEGRRSPCVLFVMIDDARGRVFCRFYESEDTASAFDLFGRYVRKYGLPGSLYVDKDSIYRVNDPLAREQEWQRGKVPVTQFGRAMQQVGVKVICANSPQAKGRVERANGTLQDRLVKALRVEAISTIPEANAFLERQYLREHNARFGRHRAGQADVHRKVPPGLVLAEILCVQESRTVGRDWCVTFAGRVLQLDKRHEKLALAGRQIRVLTLASGQLRLVYQGRRLRWEQTAARPDSAPVRLPQAVASGRLVPARLPWRPAPDHPWRSSLVTPAPLRSASLRSASLRSAGVTRVAQ